MQTKNRNKINKILVPMDNSSVATNALLVAKEIARRTEAVIDILHVGAAYIDSSQPIVPQTIEGLEAVRVNKIKKDIQPFFNEEEIPNVIYALGFPIDVISENSKDYDLIVMGSTGDHGVLDKLFGSISSGVAQNAHCPVFLIPDQYEINSTINILCACDPNNLYVDITDRLLELSIAENYSDIHLIKVAKPTEYEKNTIDKNIVDEAFKSNYEDINFYLSQFEKDKVVEGLKEYSEINNIDVIVMVTQHRNVLAKLFHKSKTKEMIMTLSKPLLVLHKN